VNAHAIGDRAVRRALDAFESAGTDARRLRFRIEHASVIDPIDRPRFGKLGVIASLQPMFAGEYARWSENRVGPSRAGFVLATRSLLDAGASLALGTDYPASDSGDPILNFFRAVTARGRRNASRGLSSRRAPARGAGVAAPDRGTRLRGVPGTGSRLAHSGEVRRPHGPLGRPAHDASR